MCRPNCLALSKGDRFRAWKYVKPTNVAPAVKNLAGPEPSPSSSPRA